MPFKIVRSDIENVKAEKVTDIAALKAGGDRQALYECYYDSLKDAAVHGYKSIAFPFASDNVIGVSGEENLNTAISAFGDFLQKEDMDIILAVSDKASLSAGKLYPGVDAFIERNYVSEQEDLLDYKDAIADADIEICDAEASADDYTYDNNITLPENECYEAKQLDAASGITPCSMNAAPKESPKHAAGFLGRIFSERKYKASGRKEKAAAESLDDRVKHLADTWQESLLKIIDDKGYTDIEVYKRANVDRKLFSKIRSNPSYQPKKITAVAFALALKLNLDDTKDFIGRAGYAFSPSSIFDLIIEYFIEQEVYDTYTINLALFDHEQPLLGE